MTLIAHVDLDAHKYSCASVGEERSILVIHKQSDLDGSKRGAFAPLYLRRENEETCMDRGR